MRHILHYDVGKFFLYINFTIPYLLMTPDFGNLVSSAQMLKLTDKYSGT